jgi:ribosomal protein S18 acetylase RimI-like enzyme
MTILRLEEQSLNAWPALQQQTSGGWVLRWAQGYTKRANSAQTLYPSSIPLDQQINACEQFYATHQQASIIRIIEPLAPPELDPLLEQRGYQHHDLSMVMTCSISTQATAQHKQLHLVEEADLGRFVSSYERMNGLSANRSAHEAILQGIQPEHSLYRVWHNQQEVACGVVVYEGEQAGLFDIAVHPTMRGQGIGKAFIAHLLATIAAKGYQHAYLQVINSNTAAIRLYQQFGFRKAYRYWYRIKSK